MFEECPAFSPASFFEFSYRVPKFSLFPFPPRKRDQLQMPDLSEILGESTFAKVYFSWSEEGLFFMVDVDQKFADCFYPNYLDGDAIEIFVDTRDLKSGFSNRFSHHFLFLPKQVHGVWAQEITRFRGEEERPLCDPKDLFLDVEFKKSSYVASIKIPADSLHGFDPSVWNKMAVAYRISRPGDTAQHFPASSAFYSIEQHPSLWCSCVLENEPS